MPLARELQSQFSNSAVQGIVGSTNTAVTAAGTTQGTATALAAQFNVVTTATLNQGVILPAGMGNGDEIDVLNSTTTNICVYPPVGGKFNNQAANMPLICAANRMHTFECIDGTSWGVDCI